MSDQSQGPGWWLASDGKWYPPTDAPGPGWWKASDGNWYPPEQAATAPAAAAAGEPAAAPAGAPATAPPAEAPAVPPAPAAPAAAGAPAPAAEPVTPTTPVAPAGAAGAEAAAPAAGTASGGNATKRALVLIGVLGLVAVLLVGVGVIVGGRRGALTENAVPLGVDEPPASSLTLADQAVVVRSDGGGAVKELSPDGSRIVLADGAEGAKDLAPGKTMILTGVTAVKVKDVQRADGQVVVTTQPAALTDIIKDGTVTWDQTPADLSKASLRIFEPSADLARTEGALGPIGGTPGAGPGAGGDTTVTARTIGLAPPPEGESAAAFVDVPLAQAGGQPVSRSGQLGDYNYNLNATISGDSISFTLHLDTDKNGFAISIDVDANVQGVGFAGNLEVSAAAVRNFRLDSANLRGQATIRARAAAGPQASRIPVNILSLPMSVQIPFPIYGIPFTVGIDASARIEVAFTSRDASVEGSLTARYDGAGGFAVQDGNLSTSGAFNPDFDDPIGSIQGASIAPAALLVTVQFPKVSLGVGFSLARASAFLAANYSFSPLISGVTNITPCKAAPVVMKIKAGYSASFLGVDVAGADKVISERSATPIDPPIKVCEI